MRAVGRLLPPHPHRNIGPTSKLDFELRIACCASVSLFKIHYGNQIIPIHKRPERVRHSGHDWLQHRRNTTYALHDLPSRKSVQTAYDDQLPYTGAKGNHFSDCCTKRNYKQRTLLAYDTAPKTCGVRFILELSTKCPISISPVAKRFPPQGPQPAIRLCTSMIPEKIRHLSYLPANVSLKRFPTVPVSM